MAAEADVTFVAANNHPRGQAAANAVELKGLLSTGKVKAPETLVQTYPEIEEFAVPESIENLSVSVETNGSVQPNSVVQGKRKKKSKTSESQKDLPL